MAKGNEAANGTQLAHQLALGREMILEYWGGGGGTQNHRGPQSGGKQKFRGR